MVTAWTDEGGIARYSVMIAVLGFRDLKRSGMFGLLFCLLRSEWTAGRRSSRAAADDLGASNRHKGGVAFTSMLDNGRG